MTVWAKLLPAKGSSSGQPGNPLQGKATGEFWVQLLLTKDYKDLDLAERTTILAALTHLTLDGPTIRNTLEARQEEASRIRKQMWEEARVDSIPLTFCSCIFQSHESGRFLLCCTSCTAGSCMCACIPIENR